MIWKSLLSAQSRRPSGLFGRLWMGRYLARANAKVNALVYDSARPEAGECVLEVGFGGGELFFRIAASLGTGRIEGLELSAEMIEGARKRAAKLGLERNTGFHQGSVEDLPFADASFDLACSVHTIYFWPDLERGLAELARVIKPGGRLVLGFSSDKALRREGWTERGFNVYSSEQLSQSCHQHGFECEQLNTAERGSGGLFYAYRGIRN